MHNGCVNTVSWNDSGEYILSGSDDQYIAVTNPYNQKCLIKYKTAHRANIFSAKFLPQTNDHGIVSCSGDGMVLYTELYNTPTATGTEENSTSNNVNLNYFNCHNNGTSYEVLTIPTESNCFMSCGEDGTVRLYDLRQSTRCHKTCCKDNILVFSHSAITAMSLSPISSTYLACGSSDGIVRIFDRRYLTTSVPSVTANGSSFTSAVKSFAIPSDTKRPYRVTSVKYSTDSSEILVSYSSDYLYIFDTTKEGVDENAVSYKKLDKNAQIASSAPVRKLRLRGDWSDTGPNARPEGSISGRVEIGQVRPQLHGTLMHRMTEVLSRMLNDPRTRIGLSGPSNELNSDNPSLFVTAARELENEVNRRQNRENGEFVFLYNFNKITMIFYKK